MTQHMVYLDAYYMFTWKNLYSVAAGYGVLAMS